MGNMLLSHFSLALSWHFSSSSATRAGLLIVSVACLHLFSCDLAGADVGAGCVDATGIEIDGLVGCVDATGSEIDGLVGALGLLNPEVFPMRHKLMIVKSASMVGTSACWMLSFVRELIRHGLRPGEGHVDP
nr:hypothetical protein [Tanacetum cinerariifolium]